MAGLWARRGKGPGVGLGKPLGRETCIAIVGHWRVGTLARGHKVVAEAIESILWAWIDRHTYSEMGIHRDRK